MDETITDTVIAIDIALTTLLTRLSRHDSALAKDLATALETMSRESAETLQPGSSVPGKLLEYRNALAH